MRDTGMRRALRRLGAALALAVAVVATHARAQAEPAPMVRLAIVIGNNQSPQVEALRYADDDALGMHQLFLDAGVDSRLLASFDAATRELHPGAAPHGRATLAALESEL